MLGRAADDGGFGPDRADGVDTWPDGGEGVFGGEVTETGIVLVEAGERIVPRAGSRAEVELAHFDAGTSVHITLPVIVEVAGSRDDRELERTVEETLRRLRLAVEAQSREA